MSFDKMEAMRKNTQKVFNKMKSSRERYINTIRGGE